MNEDKHPQGLPSIKVLEKYSKQWHRLQSSWTNKKMPQSMLFVGSLDSVFIGFVKQFSQLIVCKKKEASPCFACSDCLMAEHSEHPDVEWVKPEKSGGAIKIDQIREVQNYSYLTPQRAQHRLIVIESAERMNTAAANSLLKILEEPAEHTLFMLLAQQLSTVLPTVLSRCQIVRFTSHDDLSEINLLNLAERYSEESGQAIVVKHAEFLLDGLIAVIKKREHPCVVAAQWAKFELNSLLWFLYLIYSQLQIIQINASLSEGVAMHQLKNLAFLLSPIMIFAQIDKINMLQRKINHNLHVNQILALEDLLFSIHANL
jgi:DNA polymerase III subunit delta'